MSKLRDSIIIATATVAVTASIVWNGIAGMEAPHYESFPVDGTVVAVIGSDWRKNTLVDLAVPINGEEQILTCICQGAYHWRGEELTVSVEYHPDCPSDPYWVVGLE